MDTLIAWISKYSAPVVVIICISASVLYVIKLVTERTIEAEFSRLTKEIDLKLERRSQFEQHVLLERYKLISDLASRLSQIVTNLNRTRSGKEVKGLFDEKELVPLTLVYEDLSSKRFQLSEKFHSFFLTQAGNVLQLAKASTDEEFNSATREYVKGINRLNEMVNEEFRTEHVSW